MIFSHPRFNRGSRNMNYYVYILASKRNGTLYTGMTNDLIKRVHVHKQKIVGGFTKQYNVDKLVYFEIYNSPSEAIMREKRLKKWNRKWKLELIEMKNSSWKDIYYDLM